MQCSHALHSGSLARQKHQFPTPMSYESSWARQLAAGRTVQQQPSAPYCTAMIPRLQEAVNTRKRPGVVGCLVVANESQSSSASASSSSSSSSSSSAEQHAAFPTCQPHDIIKAVTTDGSDLYLEVISTPPPAAAAADASHTEQQELHLVHQGVIYTLSQSSSNKQQHPLGQLQPKGWQLHPNHPLVKALPGWSAALQQQQAKQRLPDQPLQLQTAAVVYSAAQLQAAVQRNPALWRDGTGPLDPPLQGLQYQTLCAGELECLQAQARGVVMVQLSVGWDDAAPQPVNNPLVLHTLQRALNNKSISIFMSSAPGGLGLTAILCAKAEPWRSWSAHMAGFGAQAALVADSPYYKLLIGRMLGYKEENIRHHIQATSGHIHPSPEVVAAVDKDMAKLSKKRPELPWKSDDGSSSSSSSSGGRGSGNRRQQQQQQQQQQSRSARKRR